MNEGWAHSLRLRAISWPSLNKRGHFLHFGFNDARGTRLGTSRRGGTSNLHIQDLRKLSRNLGICKSDVAYLHR